MFQYFNTNVSGFTFIRLIILGTLLLQFTVLHAQIPTNLPPHQKGFNKIPFEYINGFIVVDAHFQGILPMKFIFDTGAENSVLFDKNIAQIFQLPCDKKVRLIGANLNQEVIANICTEVYLRIANLPIQANSMIVLNDNFYYIDEFLGIPIGGIIGTNYFHEKIVNIDYNKMVITLIDPSVFRPSKYSKYQQFDIEVIDRKPYLECEVSFTPGTTSIAKMLLDSGAGVAAIFHYNSDTTIFQNDNWKRGVLGKGLSGEITGYVGKVHGFQFGNFNFDQMVSSFQWLNASALKNEKIVRYGLIGNLILERFDVVIDYPHKKLYLKPNSQYHRPFKYDKSGLTIYAYGNALNQYYIKDVLPNSPASEADIRENDIILKINGYSYKWYALKKINTLLSNKSGKKVKFTIQRGQEILKKEVLLRDLY